MLQKQGEPRAIAEIKVLQPTWRYNRMSVLEMILQELSVQKSNPPRTWQGTGNGNRCEPRKQNTTACLFKEQKQLYPLTCLQLETFHLSAERLHEICTHASEQLPQLLQQNLIKCNIYPGLKTTHGIADRCFLVICVTKSISKLNRKTQEDENWLLANTLRQRRETEMKVIHVGKLGGKR